MNSRSFLNIFIVILSGIICLTLIFAAVIHGTFDYNVTACVIATCATMCYAATNE